MFNEIDYAALTEATAFLNQIRSSRARKIPVEHLVEALETAGINGLVHDGSRIMERAKAQTKGDA